MDKDPGIFLMIRLRSGSWWLPACIKGVQSAGFITTDSLLHLAQAVFVSFLHEKTPHSSLFSCGSVCEEPTINGSFLRTTVNLHLQEDRVWINCLNSAQEIHLFSPFILARTYGY